MKYLLTSSILLLVSCSALNEKVGLDDDNELEEAFESVIKRELGVDIDLTPSSEEIKK